MLASLACSKVHGPKGPERSLIMPGTKGAVSLRKAKAAVVNAKAHASGRPWSLLHRCESMLTLAAGQRRATTHARKAKKKKKKKKG